MLNIKLKLWTLNMLGFLCSTILRRPEIYNYLIYWGRAFLAHNIAEAHPNHLYLTYWTGGLVQVSKETVYLCSELLEFPGPYSAMLGYFILWF